MTIKIEDAVGAVYHRFPSLTWEQAGRVFASVPSADNETIESFKKRLIESLPEDYAMFTKGDIIERIENQK